MIYDLFCGAAERSPNKLALISEELSVTYAGLLKLVKMKIASINPNMSWLVTPIRSDIDGVVLLLACAARGVALWPLKAEATEQDIDSRVGWLRTMAEKVSDHPFLLLSTSGTTGDPKLITLSQTTKIMRILQFRQLYSVEEDDVILVGTGLHMSMAQRLVLTALLNGCSAHLLPRYSPELWHIAAKKSTVVVGVPMQLQHLTSDMRRIRLVLSSSAPRLHDNGLLSATMATVGVKYYECYGTAEVAIATNGFASDSVGSVAPGATLRTSHDGEILVKSVLIHSGYFGRPDLTKSSMTDDGFFRTGDCGYFKDDQLFLTGRSSERIKVGATTVWPEDVERVVRMMPEIKDCAAVAKPDDKLGEVVSVVFVADAPVELRAIQKFCIDKLDDAQIPRHHTQVGNITRTELGKLQRRKLK